MSVDINMFKPIPSKLNTEFGLCIYGELTPEIIELSNVCNFKVTKTENYTNFFPTENTDLSKMFPISKKFSYMDGFSPNLNKHLHIGHFSNLVLAKAFQCLGISDKTIAILGDTLSGDINKQDALNKFKEYCNLFNYNIDKTFFASEMKYEGLLLKDGTGDYQGTKIIEIEDEKIVAVKSDGKTTYFYQDISLAQTLSKSTIYLTGYEQENHFNLIHKLFPHTSHIGLGLVKFQSSKLDKNEKMSTRLGNVIYMENLLTDLMQEFDNNIQLCYNVFAGYILKNNPKSDKIFNMDNIKNPKNSLGLYLSYTTARLKSAGVEVENINDFTSKELKFNYLKSSYLFNPTYLFNSLVDLSKVINTLYSTHKIKDNLENKKKFSILLSDLVFGMKKIGMFEVNEV